jgi:hypothetical protein
VGTLGERAKDFSPTHWRVPSAGGEMLGRSRAWDARRACPCTNHAIRMPGVTSAKAVAAGAVVTRDVEPVTIVGDNPTPRIPARSRNLCHQLSYARQFV